MDKLTPELRNELEGMKPKYQDKLAELLRFASAMGAYGDPYGILAVISPTSGRTLKSDDEAQLAKSQEVCPECGGCGIIPTFGSQEEQDCPTCQGTGKAKEGCPKYCSDIKNLLKLMTVNFPVTEQWLNNATSVITGFCNRVCQGTGKDPKSRPIMTEEEFRAKILTISHSDICGQPEISVGWCFNCSHYLDSDIRCSYLLDQIIALLPNGEEIRKQERDKWRQKCEDLVAMRHEISTREERERIITFMLGQGAVFVHRTYAVIDAIREGKHWQALKEKK